MKSIYVGNLPFSATDAEISDLFGQFGKVESVKLINDRETGKPRGFAFVKMTDDNAANTAISELNGKSFGGRSLKINEAKEKTDSRDDRSSRDGFMKVKNY